MGALNKAMLIGYLGHDMSVRFTQAGDPVGTFSLATTERFTSRDGQRREQTEWHRIVVWGKLCEALQEYLVKGKQVYVEGRLQTRKWTDKEGVTRSMTEVRASAIVLLGGGGHGRRREEVLPEEGIEESHRPPEDTPGAEAPADDDDIPF